MAIPLGKDQALFAELPYGYVMQTLVNTTETTGGRRKTSAGITLMDGHGHVYTDTGWGQDSEVSSWGAMAFALVPGRAEAQTSDMRFGGKSYVVALEVNPRLDWIVVARSPRGLDNPRVMAWVWLLVGGCIASLVIGLLLSRWWADKLGDTLQRLVQRADHASVDNALEDWPRGAVREFNQLSVHLASMLAHLRDRQQQFQAIFDISPVPLIVYDFGRDRLLDLNKAACQQFGLEREQWLNRPGLDLPIWRRKLEPGHIDQRLLDGQTIEASLRHVDGRELICLLTMRVLERQNERLQVWALQDVTQARNSEHALRQLNEDLERRVAERTEALQRANDEASQAIDRMHETRDYLVRSEKMAALGGLVAGVAHELNTPLGNSLMAISTLSEETHRFKRALNEGLRKSTLEAWIGCVDQATSISTRNLTRAADLVASFKQVAVDQSSAQRRKFMLDDLVGEITLTLQPTYSRLPIRFEVEIEKGISIDSYPGHLGQILTNLINNAIVHGFEDGRSGTIHIVGRSATADRVQLQVTDNGKGIPPDLLGRVFDPFVTTRMGRGGTGLGLNIAFNAATHVLGGEITVESEVGKGTTFTVEIPRIAPERAEVSKDDVQTWL